MAITYKYNGKIYKDPKKWARAMVSEPKQPEPQTTFKPAPQKKKRKSRTQIPVTWNGITYENIHELVKKSGISYYTWRYRIIESGYTCDEDLHKDDRHRPCEWNGVTYQSIAQMRWAQPEPRWTYKTYLRYINMGFTCDADVEAYHNDR